MHRTQILLEPTQYRELKARALKANLSLGEMIRRLVNRFLGETSQKVSLDSYCGILEDRQCQSTNFKKFLYPDVR